MAEQLSDALHGRGMRATPQRRQVLDAVDALGHATPEQVCEHVQRAHAGISLSTVYRTLELLEELGLVTHAHLEHGAPTYHSVQAHEHLHLVCRECGGLQEADASHGHALAEALRAEVGFVTDVRHLALHGTCARCAGREAPALAGALSRA
jgi:Fur family transcriptional regulator, ferric uptake regulator